VVVEPDPVVVEPEPVTDPDPAVADPDPAVADPDPAVADAAGGSGSAEPEGERPPDPPPPPEAPPEATALSGTYQGRIMGRPGSVKLDFLGNDRVRGLVEYQSGGTTSNLIVAGTYALTPDGAATVALVELGTSTPAVYSGAVSGDRLAGRVTIGGRNRGKFVVSR